MTIRIAARVIIEWPDGSTQIFERVKVDHASNAAGTLSHPLRPKTDYLSIVLTGDGVLESAPCGSEPAT